MALVVPAQLTLNEEDDGENHEGYVLPEGLPVAELDGVAEASAVGNLVGQRIDEGGSSEENHHKPQDPSGEAAVAVGDEHDTDDELEGYQTYGKGVARGVAHSKVMLPRLRRSCIPGSYRRFPEGRHPLRNLRR